MSKNKVCLILSSLLALLILTSCSSFLSQNSSNLFPFMKEDSGTQALSDHEKLAVLEEVQAIPDDDSDKKSNENPGIWYLKGTSTMTGTLEISFDQVGLYQNVYEAGFDAEDIYNPYDTCVCLSSDDIPIEESVIEYEDLVDWESGDIDSRAALLSVTVTVRNQDASNLTAEEEYGNPYLFDARQFDLIDWGGTYLSGDMTVLGRIQVQLFSLLNNRDEHPMMFELTPGESISFQVGFFADGSWSMDEYYVTSPSGYDETAPTEGLVPVFGEGGNSQ